LGFPQPITINGRDYYDPREIEDFKLRRRALAQHVESANAVLEKPATEPVAESAPKKANSPPARSRDKATNKPAANAQTETQAESKTPDKPARPRRARAHEHEQA
jgi:hypothetical protein